MGAAPDEDHGDLDAPLAVRPRFFSFFFFFRCSHATAHSGNSRDGTWTKKAGPEMQDRPVLKHTEIAQDFFFFTLTLMSTPGAINCSCSSPFLASCP